jgi:hypothetical protein
MSLRVCWKVCEENRCRFYFTRPSGKHECGLVWDFYVYDDFPHKGMRAPVQKDCPFHDKHAPHQPEALLSKGVCLRCLKDYFKEALSRRYYGDDQPPWTEEHFHGGWDGYFVECPVFGKPSHSLEKRKGITDVCAPPPEWCRYALEHVMAKEDGECRR